MSQMPSGGMERALPFLWRWRRSLARLRVRVAGGVEVGRSPTPDRHMLPVGVAWLLEDAPEVVILTDLEGSIVYVNRAFEVLSGYARAEVLGRTPAILKSGQQSRAFYEQLWRTLRNGGQFRGVLVNRRRDGQVYHEEKTIRPLLDEQGRIGHYLSVGRDVSERVALIERLTLAAMHDSLTGLSNRAVFAERLAQALALKRRNHEDFVVALVDLDGFKRVNDTLGHAAGDAVLRALAKRLQHQVRESDAVARLGGDEFAVLLGGVAGRHAAAEALEKLSRAFDAPMLLECGPVPARASIGGVWSGDAEALSPEIMLSQADAAMYQRKRHGGNGWCLHGHVTGSPAGPARTGTTPDPPGSAQRAIHPPAA